MEREHLQQLLEDVPGIKAVYFQPPPNVTMQYPCIVYGRDMGDTRFADNVPYRYLQRYQITLIDRSPDSEALPHIIVFRSCTFSRQFVVDNLNHYIFFLYA